MRSSTKSCRLTLLRWPIRTCWARAKLDAFLTEQAKDEAISARLALAQVIVEVLKPAFESVLASTAEAEGRGIRGWESLPPIASLVELARRITAVPATPAKPNPLRLVTFKVSTSVARRSFGATSYGAGEQAGFEPDLAAKSVYEDRAAWSQFDPRQEELIDKARKLALAAKPRPAGVGLVVAGTNASYVGDSKPSSEVGPRKREDDDEAA